MRSGVQFHNGRKVTSDDVIYNLNRILDPRISAGIVSGFFPTETTWAPKDKYAVVITTKQPWTNVFDFLSLFNIVNRETMEGPNAKSSAVGTGPFALQEWVTGDHAIFIKNQNYWQSGRPYLNGIQLTVVTDASRSRRSSKAGRRSSLCSLACRTTRASRTIPNTKAFDDKRARQALNYAIDRKRIVDTVLRG